MAPVEPTPAERHAPMSWAERLRREFNIDIETCPAFYEAPGCQPPGRCIRDTIQSRNRCYPRFVHGRRPVCHGVGGQRVDNTDSFDSESLSACTVLKWLVSFRAGTCRASTTFYPFRPWPVNLISHALLGAGDTNDERAPSAESV